jgi:hypothetical protein
MPVPLTVIVVLVVVPAGTVAGDKEIAPRAELFTAIDAALEVPPPGNGVNTLTERLPAVA